MLFEVNSRQRMDTSGPEVIKLFSSQLSIKFKLLIKTKTLNKIDS